MTFTHQSQSCEFKWAATPKMNRQDFKYFKKKSVIAALFLWTLCPTTAMSATKWISPSSWNEKHMVLQDNEHKPIIRPTAHRDWNMLGFWTLEKQLWRSTHTSNLYLWWMTKENCNCIWLYLQSKNIHVRLL